MRRRERAITDRGEIDAIIRKCRVCRLGLCDDGRPYVVPLCFGYDGRALYFHCAPEGRKLEILARNDRVCVEFDLVERFVKAEQGCGWSLHYRSVIVCGTARLIEDPAAKVAALGCVMGQYSKRRYSFAPEIVARTAVIAVEIEQITGKASQRPA